MVDVYHQYLGKKSQCFVLMSKKKFLQVVAGGESREQQQKKKKTSYLVLGGHVGGDVQGAVIICFSSFWDIRAAQKVERMLLNMLGGCSWTVPPSRVGHVQQFHAVLCRLGL